MLTAPFWPAFAIFCALFWIALRWVPTIPDAKDQRIWTRVVLALAFVYLILWALGASGPFVSWRA